MSCPLELNFRMNRHSLKKDNKCFILNTPIREFNTKAFLDNGIKVIFTFYLLPLALNSTYSKGKSSCVLSRHYSWQGVEWLQGTLRPPKNATGTLHVAHD